MDISDTITYEIPSGYCEFIEAIPLGGEGGWACREFEGRGVREGVVSLALDLGAQGMIFLVRLQFFF